MLFTKHQKYKKYRREHKLKKSKLKKLLKIDFWPSKSFRTHRVKHHQLKYIKIKLHSSWLFYSQIISLYFLLKTMHRVKMWRLVINVLFKIKFFTKVKKFKKKKKKSWRFFFLKTKRLLIFKRMRKFINKRKKMSLKKKKKKRNFLLKPLYNVTILKTKAHLKKKVIIRKKFFRAKRFKNNFYRLFKRKNRLKTFKLSRFLPKLIKENRSNLNNVLFKKRYFLQLWFSKKINFFLTKSFKNFLFMLEFTLSNVLYRSKLALSFAQLSDLLNYSLVRVNFKHQYNANVFLPKRSIIQIILTKNYFWHYFYTYNLNLKWTFRVGYCLWRFYRNKLNVYKQNPKQLPKWLNKVMYYKYNTPKYFEIDYSILTVMIVSNRITFNKFNRKQFSTNLLRLINWYWIV